MNELSYRLRMQVFTRHLKLHRVSLGRGILLKITVIILPLHAERIDTKVQNKFLKNSAHKVQSLLICLHCVYYNQCSNYEHHRASFMSS